MKKIIGIFLLLLVFGGIFSATAVALSPLEALLVWVGACAITAIIVLAVYLIVDDI